MTAVSPVTANRDDEDASVGRGVGRVPLREVPTPSATPEPDTVEVPCPVVPVVVAEGAATLTVAVGAVNVEELL
jgi:hypothetical protein